jgi:uncharacterized RDD family membrane protein YckC
MSEPAPNLEPASNLAAEEINTHREEMTELPPAGKNERVMAFLLDNVLYGAAAKLTSAAIGTAFVRGPGPGYLVLSASAGFVVFLVYWIFPVYNDGQTLGKRAFKLRIVRSGSGQDLSFLQILARETIGRLLSTIPLGMGYFMVSFRADRRCLHDLMARTRVVSVAIPKV